MERAQSAKRKLPFSGLQRRVRARKEIEPEPDSEDQYSNSDEEGSEDDDASQASDEDKDDVAAGSGSSDESEEDEDGSEAEPEGSALAASQISFSALAKAQASLPSARKKRSGAADDDEEGGDDGSDDSAPEEFDRHGKYKKPPPRSSKHAPSEMTSKRPVTRRRQVVEVPKAQSRDPRFGPLGGGGGGPAAGPQAEEALRRNYAFLNEYRDAEMKELRATIKKTRDPFEKERLQRALLSMQSKKQAQERKDAEQAVVAEHRRQEKELVKQGKTPFYLKKSEQKKRVLMDRFAGMKKGQVDKAIQRKRKKQTSKEKKELPMERRAR
ncbi:hypothetical protein JX265_013367 [Neoarthrinium moseri]|uniref:rRNA biogenesis protein RRP36 n=1 Tax=Neoarthrinium moseri TaxID=1658444 RepID=A0A9P9W8M9_9PEZI|nr:hypothetical protein JX265_013367 [Neoarthrinium moseri]